ncbi:MAG: hypothetical protein R6V58_02340 [Planctomycetota bacterium]
MSGDAKKERYLVNDGTKTHEIHATDWIQDMDGLRFDVDGRICAWFRHWAWWKLAETAGQDPEEVRCPP